MLLVFVLNKSICGLFGGVLFGFVFCGGGGGVGVLDIKKKFIHVVAYR